MTFKEKLQQEHPECVSDEEEGGCMGCPDSYGYDSYSPCGLGCDRCWNREMEDEE